MNLGSRISVALASALVLVLAGCGGDDEPSPTEAATQAAEAFVSAIEAGDFEAACGDLTDQLESQLGGEQCPDRIATLAAEGDDLEIAVTGVRVSGPKAAAQTEVTRAGAEPRESSFELLEGEQGWEVSRLGS